MFGVSPERFEAVTGRGALAGRSVCRPASQSPCRQAHLLLPRFAARDPACALPLAGNGNGPRRGRDALSQRALMAPELASAARPPTQRRSGRRSSTRCRLASPDLVVFGLGPPIPIGGGHDDEIVDRTPFHADPGLRQSAYSPDFSPGRWSPRAVGGLGDGPHLWTYEGPPHVGAMRIVAGMSGLHYVLHAPQGDTYADLLFTMIERRAARPPVTYTTLRRHWRRYRAILQDRGFRSLEDARPRRCRRRLMHGGIASGRPGGLARALVCHPGHPA